MFPLDRQLTLWLNALAGSSRPAFELLLFLCGPVPLAGCVALLLGLWWTDAEGRRGGSVPLAAAAQAQPPGVRLSRRRCVAAATAVALAFVATRVVAFASDLERPLEREALRIPIDPARWRELVSGMAGFGAFPSDHAALFVALAVALFAWSRRWGVWGLSAAVFLCVARVATGLHYASDAVVGGCLGAVSSAALMSAAARNPRPFDMVAAAFDRRPALLYPLLFVIALDFTQHFRLVFGAVFYLLPRLLGG
ncbi:MAG: phosphatase PAP2 family protein [Acidobacteria bacterium]|nr:MAG: phosphatase PAP2 family protein [Acidobacteriota bacterium]